MSQNLFGGLDRPTALTSDSPFAIASHAMADKSNPQAPRMKLPQSKAVAQAQHFAAQHQQQQQRQQQQYQQQQQQQQQQPPPQYPQQASPSAAGPSRHPGNASAGPEASGALRTHARDAYMGAGAYNSHTGTYGASAANNNHNNNGGSSSHSTQNRGGVAPPALAEMRLSRSPSPYTSTNPNFTAQQGFAQAVMMAQGGSGGTTNGTMQGGGPGGGVPSPPAFPAHYQQQFAQRVVGGQNEQPLQQQQVYSPAGSYQSAVSPQQQQQIYHAPSPSQYTTQQQSPQAQAQSSPYGPSPPYHQSQQHHQTNRSSSHHPQAPTSPYDPIQSPGRGAVYESPAAPVNLGSPAGQAPAGGAGSSTGGRRGLVPPAPAGTDAELWQMFSVMDIDNSGQLEANEVQALLAKDYRWANIEPTEDCVKMLMNIFDTDRSGTINYVEFEGLYRYITDWYNIFQQFDRDRSGTIDRKELEQALTSFGYPLPSDLVRKLEKRYAPPKARHETRPRGVTFDRFLMACVTVKHFTEAFRQRDVHREGKLTVDYSTFMDLFLSSPS